MKHKLRGTVLLFMTSMIWGSAFIAQSVGMDYIGPFTFQFARCLLAVLFLLLLLVCKDGKAFLRKWADPRLWKVGFWCGTALFMAASMQQIGIMDTDAGKAGFLTAMYIVLVPFCGLFYGKKPPIQAVISIVIAVAGLYLLSCVGVSRISRGDLFLMGCALVFAIQITIVDQYAANLDGIRLNCIQCLVSAGLSVPFMLIFDHPQLADVTSCAVPLLYAGILSSGVAYSFQIIGQKDVEPTTASLIMSTESVFAVLFGWLLLHETMTATEMLGSLLVFTAIILSQIPLPAIRHRKPASDPLK